MSKFLSKSLKFGLISVAMTSTAFHANAAYNDAGTAYSTFNVDEWTEDSANELISLTNSFACIIKNSRGELAQHVNGTWSALIDEVACGLADDNSQGGKKLANAVMRSTRASNTSPVESTSWFESSTGDRFIANVTISTSTDDLPPFGAWYFSFYKERAAGSNTSVDLTVNNLNTVQNGFTEIAQDGDDISINVAEFYTETGYSNTNAATFSIIGGNTDTVKFLGKTTTVTGGTTTVGGTAGQTDANFYYKASVNNSGVVDTATDQCLSRSVQWANNYNYRLFDATTGAAVNLEAGYGFKTADNTRGYLGAWGVWFDGNAYPFLPSSPSLTITKNTDGTQNTLKWSPGSLSAKDEVTETLANGDSFRWFGPSPNSNTWADYFISWDAGNSRFDVEDKDGNDQGDLLGSDITTDPYLGWLWSDLKRASVYWDGTTTVRSYIKSKRNATSTEASATSTTFRCTASDCPGGSNTTMARTTYISQASAGFMNGAQNDYYFYTGQTPGGSFEPFTMYHDTDDSAALSAGDTPLRFDFKVSEDDQYTDFSDNGTGAYSSAPWPYESFELIKQSDIGTGSCALNATATCTKYEWSIGGYPWDNDLMMYNAASTAIALDEPIMFNYTYDETHDSNETATITFTTTSDYNPVKSLCTESSGTYTCNTVETSDLDGRKFMLEYDGENLNGLPGVDSEGGTDTIYLKLVNLENGTTLTDTNNNSYVTKAVEIGYSFTSVAMSNCAAIDFANVSEIGFSMSGVPDITDNTNYPRPIGIDWTVPAVDAASCDVVHGVATCP